MKKVNWLERRIAAPGPFMALCLDEPSFKKACRHIKVEPPKFILNDWSQATAHIFNSPQGVAVIVCLRDWYGADPVEIAGLIVHESVHIWQEYADSIGERHPGREQEAYAIQAISRTLMAEFAKQTGGL